MGAINVETMACCMSCWRARVAIVAQESSCCKDSLGDDVLLGLFKLTDPVVSQYLGISAVLMLISDKWTV